MSTWKRVLTTDDLDSVTDTTLGTTNVTRRISSGRILQSNVNGGFLQFAGNVGGTTKNLLVLGADSDSTNTDETTSMHLDLGLAIHRLLALQVRLGTRCQNFPPIRGGKSLFLDPLMGIVGTLIFRLLMIGLEVLP